MTRTDNERLRALMPHLRSESIPVEGKWNEGSFHATGRRACRAGMSAEQDFMTDPTITTFEALTGDPLTCAICLERMAYPMGPDRVWMFGVVEQLEGVLACLDAAEDALRNDDHVSLAATLVKLHDLSDELSEEHEGQNTLLSSPGLSAFFADTMLTRTRDLQARVRASATDPVFLDGLKVLMAERAVPTPLPDAALPPGIRRSLDDYAASQRRELVEDTSWVVDKRYGVPAPNRYHPVRSLVAELFTTPSGLCHAPLGIHLGLDTDNFHREAANVPGPLSPAVLETLETLVKDNPTENIRVLLGMANALACTPKPPDDAPRVSGASS